MSGRFKFSSRTKTAEGCYKKFSLVGWKITVDNEEKMLKCPYCECQIIAESYFLAIGTKGTRFCPYCGAQLQL